MNYAVAQSLGEAAQRKQRIKSAYPREPRTFGTPKLALWGGVLLAVICGPSSLVLLSSQLSHEAAEDEWIGAVVLGAMLLVGLWLIWMYFSVKRGVDENRVWSQIGRRKKWINFAEATHFGFLSNGSFFVRRDKEKIWFNFNTYDISLVLLRAMEELNRRPVQLSAGFKMNYGPSHPEWVTFSYEFKQACVRYILELHKPYFDERPQEVDYLRDLVYGEPEYISRGRGRQENVYGSYTPVQEGQTLAGTYQRLPQGQDVSGYDGYRSGNDAQASCGSSIPQGGYGPAVPQQGIDQRSSQGLTGFERPDIAESPFPGSPQG